MSAGHSTDPYLVAGLGNSGRAYRNNRHNAGFMLVDLLAIQLKVAFSRRQSEALVTTAHLADSWVVLAKPQTMMNQAGRSVGSLIRHYRIRHPHVMLLYDDLDLPLGAIRIREHGGSGGHKGLQSVLDKVGTHAIPRLRLGIGRPPPGVDPVKYVLDDFTGEEKAFFRPSLARAADCIRLYLHQGIQAAMTECNQTADEG